MIFLTSLTWNCKQNHNHMLSNYAHMLLSTFPVHHLLLARRHCFQHYWSKQAIISLVHLWALWAIIISGLATHTHIYKSGISIKRVASYYLIDFPKHWMKCNSYLEILSNQKPIARWVTVLRGKPTSISQLKGHSI